jgi:hypothetical protein
MRSVDLDEALCHEILGKVRAAGLVGKFWQLSDRRWQFVWFHPDGSIASIPVAQLTRRWAFIFACAEFRDHGILFEPGEVSLPGELATQIAATEMIRDLLQ